MTRSRQLLVCRRPRRHHRVLGLNESKPGGGVELHGVQCARWGPPRMVSTSSSHDRRSRQDPERVSRGGKPRVEPVHDSPQLAVYSEGKVASKHGKRAGCASRLGTGDGYYADG